MTKETKNEEK